MVTCTCASRREPRDLGGVFGGGAAQYLDGDLRAERDVLGGVDDADPARSNLVRNAVFAAEHGAREIPGRRGGLALQARGRAFERGDAVLVERARSAVAVDAIGERADHAAERGADAGRNAHRNVSAGRRHRAGGDDGARRRREIRAEGRGECLPRHQVRAGSNRLWRDTSGAARSHRSSPRSEAAP